MKEKALTLKSLTSEFVVVKTWPWQRASVVYRTTRAGVEMLGMGCTDLPGVTRSFDIFSVLQAGRPRLSEPRLTRELRCTHLALASQPFLADTSGISQTSFTFRFFFSILSFLSFFHPVFTNMIVCVASQATKATGDFSSSLYGVSSLSTKPQHTIR